MRHHVEQLLTYASSLACPGPELTYAVRLEIERSVFVTAKALAAGHLGYDLHGFNSVSREAVENVNCLSEKAHECQRIILLGFQVRAFLSAIASGDPYELTDVSGDFAKGRSAAIRCLGAELTKYAKGVENVIGN